TRRCLDSEGCGIRSWRSSSPTDRSDVASRLSMARRLGSARMAKADSMGRIFLHGHMPVKEHLRPVERRVVPGLAWPASSRGVAMLAHERTTQQVRTPMYPRVAASHRRCGLLVT